MNKQPLIGRTKELQLLKNIRDSGRAELVALYGRRRVGKTFLTRSAFEDAERFLEVTGKKDGNQATQLKTFAKAYAERFLNSASIELNSWEAAFELLCFKHIPAIKKALGISGISIDASVWRKIGDKEHPGAQVDLVLDRADKFVNLCEIKYNTGGMRIDKKLRNELLKRQALFKEITKTKKAIGSVVISSGGFLTPFTPDSAIIAGITGEELFL